MLIHLSFFTIRVQISSSTDWRLPNSAPSLLLFLLLPGLLALLLALHLLLALLGLVVVRREVVDDDRDRHRHHQHASDGAGSACKIRKEIFSP